jgi:putative restriction endonuclease
LWTGEIHGIKEGKIFDSRVALAKAKIHPPNQKGISGSQFEGADSIVLSGGYEDDQDHGHTIIYTGSGGRDSNTKKQTRDQELLGDNLALAHSKLEGLPVRVTRGHTHKSPFSPEAGYRYAGIFYIEDYWREKGNAGFDVWRFRLVASNGIQAFAQVEEDREEYTQAARRDGKSSRIVRDRKVADRVKKLYAYSCQVCGVVLKTTAGAYAEAAHIKPLGEPHNGPDVLANILCLCPNHHVLFDNGGFTINDDFSLNNIDGVLNVHSRHAIDLSLVRYHREHYPDS